MIYEPGDLPEGCTETKVSKPRVTGCTLGRIFFSACNPFADLVEGFFLCGLKGTALESMCLKRGAAGT